jgi:Na+/proline symporter
MAQSNDLQVLPPSAGYGIVIGIGGIFALFMLGLTWLQNRYTTFSTQQAEEFNTASRSVKPGLISAGIVSSWTWSATLLTSSTFAYSYGVCGPMWYAAMGTLQILLFGLIAIKIKAHAPGAHTMPEIVRARHGTVAHLTYLYNGLATNMLVGACLVLGGAQVVAALPAVVAAYVIAGGLRSTFIADYTHTVILFVAILLFGFLVAARSELIGSPGRLYDLLQEASREMPIDRNTDGSYLAFRSVDGLVFAIDIFVSGFTTVWLDQAYWQRAIASRPETSVKAYLLGGIAWYGRYPFSFVMLVSDVRRHPVWLCNSYGPRLRSPDQQSGLPYVSPSTVVRPGCGWPLRPGYGYNAPRQGWRSSHAHSPLHGRDELHIR